MNSATIKILGEKLRLLRVENYLTQEGLARRISVSKNTISSYERQPVASVSLKVFLGIAGTLSLTPDKLREKIGTDESAPAAPKRSSSKPSILTHPDGFSIRYADAIDEIAKSDLDGDEKTKAILKITRQWRAAAEPTVKIAADTRDKGGGHKK